MHARDSRDAGKRGVGELENDRNSPGRTQQKGSGDELGEDQRERGKGEREEGVGKEREGLDAAGGEER